MHDLVWDKRMIAEFIEQACLTDDEVVVLKDLAYDKSIVETAMKYHMSETRVSDIRKRLRDKYDRVQPYSDVLPPRIRKK